MKKIRVITPIVANNYRSVADFDFLNTENIKISHSFIDYGPQFISSIEEHEAAKPGTIEKIDQAVAEGINAIIIDCMGDTAIKEIGDKYSIPIIGPTFASFKMAHVVAKRIGILALTPELIPAFEEMWQQYGFISEKLYTESLTETNFDLEHNHTAIIQNVIEQSIKLANNQGVDTIILGCSLFSKELHYLRDKIVKHAAGVNIIDPIMSAYYLAQFMIDSELQIKN